MLYQCRWRFELLLAQCHVEEETRGNRAHKFQLKEAATVSGVAVGKGGNSQACMGIASGDFNRNGCLDLFVTNFFHEANNLFIQNHSGSFSDQVQLYGLAEPSHSVLGFGTQATDLNNDGWQDIAVLNGHVYNARDDQIPFRMRPNSLADLKIILLRRYRLAQMIIGTVLV